MGRRRGVIEPDWQGDFSLIDDIDYESRPKKYAATGRNVLKETNKAQNLKSPKSIYQERAAALNLSAAGRPNESEKTKLENARLKLDNATREGLLQRGKIYALSSLQKITNLNAEQTLQILRSWNEENTAIVYFEIKHNRDTEPWFAVLNNDKKLWDNKAKALLTEIRRMFPEKKFKRKEIRNFITKHGMDLNNFIVAMAQEGFIINIGYGLYEIIPTPSASSDNNNLNENRS